MIPGLGKLLSRHLVAREARPAVRWMNRFAIIATALGLCAWLTTLNVMEGLQREIRNDHLRNKAHILLEGPLRNDLPEVAEKIRSQFGSQIKELKIKLQFEGLVEPSKGRKIYTGSGVVIEGDANVKPGEVVIGEELGNVLHADTMDSFRLRNVWKLEGAPLDLKFGGLRRTELFDVDRFYVWVSQSDLDEWLGGEKLKSRLEIFLNEPYKAPPITAQMKTIDPSFKDWTELDSALWHSLDLERKAMAIALFFVVLFGALAVSSALSLRIAEKRREIGLLRALGADTSKIFWLYEFEGLILGGIGLVLGLALSWGVTWAIGNWGMLPSFFYSQNLPVDWSWARALTLLGLSFLTVGIASLVPSRKLFQWDIISLLKS